MSLCLLKTRDLSWQDHSINIEVIMAPRRTDLLSKQHRSLGNKCDKRVTRYELNKNSVLKHLQLEKHHIGQRATELYVLKAKRFLDGFPVDMKREILNRRSFSIALNKLRDEIMECQERVKSEPLPERKEITKTDPVGTTLPELNIVSRQNSTRKQIDKFYITELPSPRSDELPPVVVETEKARPVKPTLRRANSDLVSTASRLSAASSSSARPRLTRQKSVRFENDVDSEGKKASLHERVREFIKEQEEFNSQVQQLHTINDLNDLQIDEKDKLISAFDNFCKSSSTKTQLQKLVKLASKFKVTNRSMANTASNFRSSKSYKALTDLL